jgi:hypothetical protein
MSTGIHDCRRKSSENVSVQSLHFQLIDLASPIARSGYNLERLHFQLIVLPLPIARYGYNYEDFILTHVPLSHQFDDDWFKLSLSFGIKLILEDFEPLVAMLFCQHAHFT